MSALTFVARTVRQNFLFRLYKHYLFDSIMIVKQSGFRALLQQRGWKFFGLIIGYYTVRDTLLYIVIPYGVAAGLF